MKYATVLRALATLLIASQASFASAAPPPRAPISFGVDDSPGALHRLFNIYHETITVFDIVDGAATIHSRFKPSRTVEPYGLAVDRQGRLYTTLSAKFALSGSPRRMTDACAVACIEIFTPTGKLVAQIPAPILPGVRGGPSLTNVSVDLHGNVYFSDGGHEAVYFVTPVGDTWVGPTVIVHDEYPSSASAAPHGDSVFVSGGCGYRSATEYVRTRSGFKSGACSTVGTTVLSGAAADDRGAGLTTVDNSGRYIDVSSAGGNGYFENPREYGIASSVALGRGGAFAYVASGNKVYVFAGPVSGWPSLPPPLVATYKDIPGLSFIAVEP